MHHDVKTMYFGRCYNVAVTSF